MTSPSKRSVFKSAVVAGPASGNNPKVNNENDEPNTKSTDKGTTRPPPLVDVPTLLKLDARSSISPSHPNLEQSMLAIELQNQFAPDTKRRKKSVRFALDNPCVPPPRTPKVRSKKRLIRFEDHPGLSRLEIGALRAARIMSMPSPPKFGAADYDSDSSDDEEDTINFMSRRPTKMKPAQASAPPAEGSSGNIFARNGNIFAPIQAPSQVQAWPVGSYKAAMAAERAKKAEEKARREETQREEAKQKAQDENAKIDAEEEAAVVEMLESSPMQLSEELPETPTDAPEDVLDDTHIEAPQQDPQQSSNEQADDIPEPITAAPLSLSSSPPPPPPPGSHQPVSAAPETQLISARKSEQALADVAEESITTRVVKDTKDTEDIKVAEVAEDEDEWILVDTPAPQSSSAESSNQPRRTPKIPQVIQRVTRSMSKGIQAKLRVVSGGSKKKSSVGASNVSKVLRGAARARQILTKAKSEMEMTRTKTRTVSAATSRAQTMPAIHQSPSVPEPQPTASSSNRSQLKRRWAADDVQESSSKKRKFSGQEPPAKKPKLSSSTEVSDVVPQAPAVPTSQQVVSSPRVSGKRRRDADEDEPSSIGARLVKRLRKL